MSKRKNVSFRRESSRYAPLTTTTEIPKGEEWPIGEEYTQSVKEYLDNNKASNMGILENNPRDESLFEAMANRFQTRFGKMSTNERRQVNKETLEKIRNNTTTTGGSSKSRKKSRKSTKSRKSKKSRRARK
jgi:adenylate kinase family enzyme